MSRTVETAGRLTSWPTSLAGERPRRPARRLRAGAAEPDPVLGAGRRSASGGVLLRWGPVPAPRMAAARQAPLLPPEVWCVDQERGIPRGADVFLMQTGQAPGLVARGVVSRPPFLAARSDQIGTVGQHIGVEWLELLSSSARIPIEVLDASVPEWQWSTGVPAAEPLPRDLAARVEHVWLRWRHTPQPRPHTAEWVRDTPGDGSAMRRGASSVSGLPRLSSVGHRPRANARRVG